MALKKSSIVSVVHAVLEAGGETKGAYAAEHPGLKALRIRSARPDESVAAHDQSVATEHTCPSVATLVLNRERLPGEQAARLLRSVDVVAAERVNILRQLRDALDRNDIDAIVSAARRLVGRD